MDITSELFLFKDEKFKEFNAKLIPAVDKSVVIGVKTPELKKIAKELISSGKSKAFISELPHKYFEENQIHAFIISEIKDFDEAVSELEKFLPFIDNWATCDQLISKAIKKTPEKILPQIDVWINSGEAYTVRFAIGLLMRYFLDERFEEKYLERVAQIKSDEYYVNMMCAWYFSTALAKQYEKTLPYFKEKKLSVWVHNKSIQKAKESYRVSDRQKEELNKMKINPKRYAK